MFISTLYINAEEYLMYKLSCTSQRFLQTYDAVVRRESRSAHRQATLCAEDLQAWAALEMLLLDPLCRPTNGAAVDWAVDLALGALSHLVLIDSACRSLEAAQEGAANDLRVVGQLRPLLPDVPC